MVHAENWADAIKFASRWVSDAAAVHFAQHFCLFGSIEEVVERVLVSVRAGATGFYLRHLMSYTLPHELIETFGSGVLPEVQKRLTEHTTES